MKKFILCCTAAMLVFTNINVTAQDTTSRDTTVLETAIVPEYTAQDVSVEKENDYRRSSLYSILITHPSKKFNEEIYNAFMALETPDKYNNHDLPVRSVAAQSEKKALKMQIDTYLEENLVAKGLVSKWFQRDPNNGSFGVDLIMERGLYDADAIDIEAAKQSKRGIDALADKGYELIENTFVIVNDITYVDHEENAQKAKNILSFISAVATAVTGEETILSTAADLGASISDQIAGFTVKITTHLYQLEWNDSTANFFYDTYYFDRPGTDSASVAEFYANEEFKMKKDAYSADCSSFRLKYVGSYNEKSAKPVMRGLREPTDVFKKVCARAIDKNILELQKKFDQFKVKVPLYSTEPLMAKIGMKEGVSPKSKYEVLMAEFNKKTGKIEYKRKGVIKPIPGKIWDNRYMATEEEAVGSELSGTEFKVVSGTGFVKGMLIREIK